MGIEEKHNLTVVCSPSLVFTISHPHCLFIACAELNMCRTRTKREEKHPTKHCQPKHHIHLADFAEYIELKRNTTLLLARHHSDSRSSWLACCLCTIPSPWLPM